MHLDDLIHNSGQWLQGKGENSDIVMSSRIRLARNIAMKPFPSRADKKELLELVKKVEEVVVQVPLLKDAAFLKIHEMDNIDRQFLVERHLMSHEHAANPEGKAVVVSPNEILAIMVNEEDHVRLQVLQSGLNLDEAWNVANMIDDGLSEHLDFAFMKQWGYLTACPTNTGTAMRGSVMMHLPALVMTKQINKVLAAVAKLNFTSRGFYGEGTHASGNFYQISNQSSLGHSEEEVIENINGLIRQIIEQEEQARQALLVQNKPMLEDKIFRSFGLLINARIISSQETIDLLSMVRLGIDLGIVQKISREAINQLFIKIQPAHLQKIEGKKLSASERDSKRASVIRKTLGGK